LTHRFHVLGIPHTATNEDWLCCAYTQKVLKLCRMLKDRGHHVIHYGNAASEVPCDHVSVTEESDLGEPADYLRYDIGGRLHRLFITGAIAAIERCKQPGDFLLCMWGAGHKAVADAHSDLTVVEPGIGYAGGHFAFFKAFESYAMLHAYKGLDAVARGNTMSAYEVVIPNYFDPADFEYRNSKGDYLLFLGRVDEGKGTHIAVEVARRCGLPIVIAGPGEMTFDYDKVERVGMVGLEQRRGLLAGAQALIAPSTFLEPFCGVVTEAHFSGTPTITHDWGAQAENNLHGLTGWRCRTLEQFTWAVDNIGRIAPLACRRWAESNFALDHVAAMYDEFWDMAASVMRGQGWYQAKPDRAELSWLAKAYPFQSSNMS
jgi:glycosyltransferase involved in cell wall biosynthesis